MFEKMKLNKEIKKCKQHIEEIEKRRARSQAALIEAILKNAQPNDDDVDYFNQFTSLIEKERDNLHKLQRELEKLK
ncbi:MAG: hypothetical protein K6G89_02475 [Clostridia bacterium]|nr:hypothetical protein [Clostridia bacterium]